MSKAKKILLAIGLSLLGACAIAVVVFYNLYPVQTKGWIMTAWEWLNQPLPVVGVSTLFVLIFAWRVFVNSSFGKKQVNVFKRRTEDVENAMSSMKNEYDKLIGEYDTKISNLEVKLHIYEVRFAKLCDMIPNKKVKDFGKAIEYGEQGKETVDNETKAN